MDRNLKGESQIWLVMGGKIKNKAVERIEAAALMFVQSCFKL